VKKKDTKKIHLITGINGFSGYFLTNYILVKEKNAMVVGIDLQPKLTSQKKWLARQRIIYYQSDLSKDKILKNILKKHRPNYIYHLAGKILADSLNQYLKANYQTTKNLLREVKRESPQARVLLTGSAAEYGSAKKNPFKEASVLQPINAYGLSKKKQTEFFLKAKNQLLLNLVRPFNLIGPGTPKKLLIGNIIEQIKEQKNKQPVINIFNPENARDFLDVREAVKFYYLINKNDKIVGEIFNLCSGRPVKIKNFCQKLKREGKRIGWQLSFKEVVNQEKVTAIYGSCAKAKKILGWKPKIPLVKSLKFILTQELK